MIRELDSRTTDNGDVVSLVWNDVTDTVELHVQGASGTEPVCVPVRRDQAREVFAHPYVYLPQ
jgi:hypothetical protein